MTMSFVFLQVRILQVILGTKFSLRAIISGGEIDIESHLRVRADSKCAARLLHFVSVLFFASQVQYQ